MNFKSNQENHQMDFSEVSEMIWCKCNECEECLANIAESAMYQMLDNAVLAEVTKCIQKGMSYEEYILVHVEAYSIPELEYKLRCSLEGLLNECIKH